MELIFWFCLENLTGQRNQTGKRMRFGGSGAGLKALDDF